MEFVSIGVDLGQKRDPSAIVVAEQTDPHPRRQRAPGPYSAEVIETPSSSPRVFIVRHLERLPLGTAYPAVATRVAQVARGVWQRVQIPQQAADGSIITRDRWWRPPAPYVLVDATGVGRPVVELIEAELTQLEELAYRLEAATFTHGDRLTRVDGEQRVGKAYLVSRLQALLQTERLKLPRTAEAEQLARELLEYEIHVDQNANDTYGAFKVGTHDDLVTALGLAVLEERRHHYSMVFDRYFNRLA